MYAADLSVIMCASLKSAFYWGVFWGLKNDVLIVVKSCAPVKVSWLTLTLEIELSRCALDIIVCAGDISIGMYAEDP